MFIFRVLISLKLTFDWMKLSIVPYMEMNFPVFSVYFPVFLVHFAVFLDMIFWSSGYICPVLPLIHQLLWVGDYL